MAFPNNRWHCPTCTYLNWSSSVKCSLCGSPRVMESTTPKATIAKIKSYTQSSLCIDKQTEKHHKQSMVSTTGGLGDCSSDKWTCSACTYRNGSNTSNCVLCQCPRDTAKGGGSPSATKRHGASIFECVNSTNTSTGGAVGGVSHIDPLEATVKKHHHKQRHHSENNRLNKRWKCSNCTYENYTKSVRCTMCGASKSGINGNGGSSADSSSCKKTMTSSSRDNDVRQLRNRLSTKDLLFLTACEGMCKGDVASVKDYIRNGGDKLRQLTRKDIQALGVEQQSKYTAGSTLIDLALRYHNSELLTYLLTPAPIEAHKRLPSQSDIDLASNVRHEILSSLRQREGPFPCYYFTTIATFTLPKEINSFCDCTVKTVMDEVIDLDVLRVLEEENPVINWNQELLEDLHSRLYPLWNRTAGDCLLDSALQATWGVSDRESSLRKALADSITECSSQFYKCWYDAEVMTANSQGFTLDVNQLKIDWQSLISQADHKGHSLDQTHVFVLAHILRRPIMVYGVKVIENFRGEKLGPVNYEGVYLPLLWESSFCSNIPIALAYTRGHFSALVSVANDSDHVAYLPLVDCRGNQLPVHFLSEHQQGHEESLLMEYCDCYTTDKGLWTAMQRAKLSDTSSNVNELVENWLNRFHQLNKNNCCC